jgi:aerobic-type carbon monoxide dehydrogenase small subunit (CoxS/CutS family)
MRIKNHPILTFETKKEIKFMYNNIELSGVEGDMIASALHAQGVKKLSESIHLNRPRGFYCAIGNCASCNMIVNGIPNVRTCVTPLVEGMIVETQDNKGELYVK